LITAIERLASRLRAVRGSAAKSGAPAADSDWGYIALIVTLIAKRIVAGQPQSLRELEPELSQITLAPHAGAEVA
jgi:hypothetical protein